MTIKENELSRNSKSIIESIIKSNELSTILFTKLEKHSNSYKKYLNGGKSQYKGSLAKLEEGYESSDSGDSLVSTLTTSAQSEYSSFSDISSLNSDIQSLSKENTNVQKDNELLKILKEINDLKTFIPQEKSNKNSFANSHNSEAKNDKNIIAYPLEFFEIFPNIKKFEISNKSESHDSIEKPLFFIKNLILKNYNESLLFTQNKFHLNNFKNSPDFQYKIMNISQPINTPLNSENITCMILGLFRKSKEDRKNKNIANINTIISKLSQTQNINVNFIFFGYKKGLIMQYVLLDIKANSLSDNSLPADNFFPYKEYSIEKIIKEDQLDKHVLCMSLSDDENFLLAGYASGHIIIWKTLNSTVLYCFDDIFNMPVVSCEFLSGSENNKDFIFLASDLIGKVRLIQYTKNTFIDKHNIIVVSNSFYPNLLIKRLKFIKEERKEDFNIEEIINKINHKSHICLIGNLKYIELFMIKRASLNITSILIIQNPDFNLLIPLTEEIKKNRVGFFSQNHLKENLSKIEFPDASFGLGYLGDLIKDNNEKGNKDNREPYILLAISWKNKIILYYFEKDLSDMQEIGWYLNNSIIIKIGFIGTSLIYFIDKFYNIKIINIKLLNKALNKTIGEKEKKILNFDININNKKIKNKFIIPLTDIITLETPIKTISKNFTETINYYNPFIINSKYNIYLLQEIGSNYNNQKNYIKHIHLLSYREFFNETMKTENWDIFFCKFIDIFKSNTNTFGGIPEYKENKMNLLVEEKPIKLVKNNYLGFYLENNFNQKEIEEEENSEDIDMDFKVDYDFLSIGIEFSIEIGSLDFIYNEIKKLKKQNKFKKDLVFQLEPFIFSNKFQNNPNLISQELIIEIINYYISNEKEDELQNFNISEKPGKLKIVEESTDKLFRLDLILCHLNIGIVKKIQTIEDIIRKNKLYCSILYYYSNGLNDFIKPLLVLFEEFILSEPTPISKENNINFLKKAKHSRGFYRDNYINLIKSLKTGNFDLKNNLFITKEYIGHLILSFIQLTLKGYSFPNMNKIPINIYDNIIPELFLFLTKKNIAKELISFDSFSYFETLTSFIIREDEINTIVNNDLTENSFNFINNNETNNSYKNKFCPLNINKIDLEKLKSNIKEYIDSNNNNNIINDSNLKINQDCFFELIYKIMELCENQKIFANNLLIKFDFYLFLIKICLKIGGVSLKNLDRALLSIFYFHNDLKNIKKNMDQNGFSQYLEKIDKFICHYNIIKRNQTFLDELSSIINFVIKKYYINNTDINTNNENINNLLKMCTLSNFIGVKIFLYELKKEYILCIKVFLNENRKISKRVFTFINKTLTLFQEKKDEKNFLLFKNEIKKIISNLAGVSSSETFKIIQKWFNSKDIISNLNNLPKLQFKYLDKIKSIYKRKINNEKSMEKGNDSLKKEYSEIITIYIKLLLYFERESRVLKILKKEEEFINVKECLKVCLNKSIDASIILYKMIGDEKSALKLCLDKIKQDYDNIIKSSNRDMISNLFDEIKKLIEQSIEICEHNSENSAKYKKRRNSVVIKNKGNDEMIEDFEKYDMGEDFWIELFDQIYKILTDAEKQSSLIFVKIKNYLSQKIENLLIAMIYYVDFSFIIKNVSNDLEFSLFKKFLNKIFYTKSHLSNLYNSYINLLSNVINKNMHKVEKSEQEGKTIRLTVKEENEDKLEKEELILDRVNKYNFDYNYSDNKGIKNGNLRLGKENNRDKNPKIYKSCFLCKKMLNFIDENSINEATDLIIFKCSHIYHENCLLKETEQIQNNFRNIKDFGEFCPKCVNLETEFFSFISEEKDDKKLENKIINELPKKNNNKQSPNSSNQEKIKKIKEKKHKLLLKKLNALDNNYFGQIDILGDTLGGI